MMVFNECGEFAHPLNQICITDTYAEVMINL